MSKFADILTRMETLAKSIFPNLDLADDTVEKEIFLAVPAKEIAREDTQIELIRRTSSVALFIEILDDDDFIIDLMDYYSVDSSSAVLVELTALADELYGDLVPRPAGEYARGTVTLEFSTGSVQTVAAGFQVRQSGTNSLSYSVSQTTTGSPVLRGTTYFLSVNAIAEGKGSDYNTPAATVIEFVDTLPGLMSVNNENAISGGTESLTLEDYLELVRARQQGYSLPTPGGVKAEVLEAGVYDAVVYKTGDLEMQGRVGADVYVISEDLQTKEDSFYVTDQTIAFHVPDNQPVKTVISLSGHPSATFEIIEDQGYNRGSIRAEDKVTIGTDIPVRGEDVTLTYISNQAIADLQALFETPNVELFTDVLVKEAIKRLLKINISIQPEAGVDRTQLELDIEVAIQAYVNALKIGETAYKSEVTSAVQGVQGVESVVISRFSLEDSGEDLLDLVSVSSVQYIRSYGDDIRISFT